MTSPTKTGQGVYSKSPIDALHDALLMAACIGTRSIGECTRAPELRYLRSSDIAEIQRGHGFFTRHTIPTGKRRRVPVILSTTPGVSP